jgi:formamidopyrimidine-DNA glycosylase
MRAMPELPEVEIAARHLRRWTRGRRIDAVEAERTRVVGPRGPKSLQPLVGARFRELRRWGKNLLFTLGGAAGPTGLFSHLGMTGKWLRARAGEPAPRFSRARLALDDGRVLHYCDMRLFGRLQVVPGARFETLRALAGLGRDPLEEGIDVEELHARLARTRLPVKVALMDQRLLPGVGNIQASEALHRARIDPRRPARALTAAEVRGVADGVLASIRDTIALEERASSAVTGAIAYVEEPGADNPFGVYGRAGERCPQCRKATIERIVQAGRGTYFCARCQR